MDPEVSNFSLVFSFLIVLQSLTYTMCQGQRVDPWSVNFSLVFSFLIVLQSLTCTMCQGQRVDPGVSVSH